MAWSGDHATAAKETWLPPTSAHLSDGTFAIQHEHIRMAFIVLACVSTGAAVGLMFVYGASQTLVGRVVAAIRRSNLPLRGRMASTLEAVRAGFAVVSRWRFWLAQTHAFLCWGIFLVSPIPLLIGFGLDLKHAILTAIATNALTTAAFLLPSAPSALGTWHVFCLIALYWINPGIDPDRAIAYTVLAHVVGTLSPALPGLFFIPRD